MHHAFVHPGVIRACAFVPLLFAGVGCDGDAPPPSTNGGGDSAATAAGGGSCYVLASNYDQSCARDSDCALVPPGGNVCGQCDNGTGCLQCPLASVNVRASARYLAVLGAAVMSCPQFGSGCPEGVAPLCQEGVCTTSLGPICGPNDGVVGVDAPALSPVDASGMGIGEP